MKNKISLLFLALAALMLTGCQEQDKELMFDRNYASICFSTDSITDSHVVIKDSVATFSFALMPSIVTEYVVEVPVMVTGLPAATDRTFQLRVDEQLSTARQGEHFSPLAASYTMPAGELCVRVPVTFYRTKDLQEDSRTLVLQTLQSTDFPDLMIAEKSQLRIAVSDMLEQPEWWYAWRRWFGKYSRAKYQQWIAIYGDEALDSKGPGASYAWAAPDIAYHLSLLRDYFEANPTLDDDGELITVPTLMQ